MPNKNGGGGGGGIYLPPAGGLSYVVCGEPLLKAEYLDGIVGLYGSVQAGEGGGGGAGGHGPVVYMDFDMMYGGFVGAGMASRQPGGMLHVRPGGGAGARSALVQAVSAVSAGAATVIVDTLNGLYGVAGDTSRAVQRADASIMMLAMAASSTRSRIIVACVAEPHGDGTWSLLPGRRKLAAVSMCAGSRGRVGEGAASLLHLVRGRAGPVVGPVPAAAADRRPHSGGSAGAAAAEPGRGGGAHPTAL